MRKAADQGSAGAQYDLGFQYEHGQGVAKDLDQAGLLYRKAADQGNAQAQANLGILYTQGEGVPQNNVTAYMWMTIASQGIEKRLMENLTARMTELAGKMSPQEIAEARRLAKEWKPSTK
jgi:TPR repeat protein